MMKKELKRIEETLHQLTDPTLALTASGGVISSRSQSLSASPSKSPSFEVVPRLLKSHAGQTIDRLTTDNISLKVESGASDSSSTVLPEAAPTVDLEFKLQGLVPPIITNLPQAPSLPKLKVPTFSSHRHVVNPALATNLLQEIHGIVAEWQRDLNTVLRQIQDLYLEGPIVDGWLESHTGSTPSSDTPVLRHGEVNHLMDYVEQICSTPISSTLDSGTTPDYRLCGLNADGQLWSSPCPSEQVPAISLAIARHQKLRQLLARQQYLETRLSQLAETLVIMHSQLKQ